MPKTIVRATRSGAEESGKDFKANSLFNSPWLQTFVGSFFAPLIMFASSFSGSGPSEARIIRILKDGYWDRTEVIAMADGSERVRKSTKGATAPGPWSVRSLRREISYIAGLPEAVRNIFPQILNAWDRDVDGSPDVGYEMPYHPGYKDAGELAREGKLDQAEIDLFQEALAEAVIGRLHIPEKTAEPLSEHLTSVVLQAFADLQRDPALAPLVGSSNITLNGVPALGPREAFEKIRSTSDALRALDVAPTVRLHGDFFLENILWRHAETDGALPRLMLIDPVSVAGVFVGPPVFDLVKYESYAKGELPGLRSAWVDIAGFEPGQTGAFCYRIRWEEEGLRNFQTYDWRSRFRRLFEQKYGEVDRRLYCLLDGYFSVAMAVNTTGAQRKARLLKAAVEFNSVLGTDCRDQRGLT